MYDESDELRIDPVESELSTPGNDVTTIQPFRGIRSLSEELSGGAGAMYLREIGNHTLLTAQEEVSLAQHLEAGKAAANQLAEAGPDLEPERRAALECLVAEGDSARRRPIECNLRLVVAVARRYLNRELSFLDLVQEGNIGLQVGVDKYDWRRGFRFSTYAYWWIRQAVTRAIATDVGHTGVSGWSAILPMASARWPCLSRAAQHCRFASKPGPAAPWRRPEQ